MQAQPSRATRSDERAAHSESTARASRSTRSTHALSIISPQSLRWIMEGEGKINFGVTWLSTSQGE